jgi:hypothetical protein
MLLHIALWGILHTLGYLSMHYSNLLLGTDWNHLSISTGLHHRHLDWGHLTWDLLMRHHLGLHIWVLLATIIHKELLLRLHELLSVRAKAIGRYLTVVHHYCSVA